MKMVWLSLVSILVLLEALVPEDLVGRGILGVKALSRRRQSQFSSLHHRVRRSRSEAAKAASEATAMASKLGPAFHTQPPSIYTFSNDTGGILDCTAYGVPPPQITWLRYDPGLESPPLTELTSGVQAGGLSNAALWQILAHNNSLKFRSFSASDYNPTVHKAAYVCRASSESGIILSRIVNVKSVLRDDYAVRVRPALSTASRTSSGAVQVSSGNSLVLRCEVSMAALASHLIVDSWTTKNGRRIAIPSHSQYYRDNEHLMLSNGDLVVINVKRTEEYSCTVKNTLTEQLAKSEALQVHVSGIEEFHRRERPVMQDPSATYIEAKLGEDAILPCFSLGSPTPLTSWFKESHHHLLNPLPGDPRYKHITGAVIIKDVNTSDAGNYRCVSRNSIGESSTTLHLIVRPQMGVSVEPDLLVADFGSQAEFTCKIYAQDDRPTPMESLKNYVKAVKWLQNGRVVTASGKNNGKFQTFDSILRVNNVQTDDTGVYQCFVTLDSGRQVQSSGELRLGDILPTLSYSFIDQTVQPGPLVSLKCSASGNPTPRISWTLDGYDLPQKDRFMIGQYVTVHGDVISHLNISEALIEDGGLYGCEATNRAGSKKHFGRLNIYGPPTARNFPRDLKAIEGQSFLLSCPMGGFPLEGVSWEKEGVELNNDGSDLRRKVFKSNGTLLLKKVVKEADEGGYICTAKSRNGRQTASASTLLRVIVAPKVVPFLAPSNLQQGDRTTLTCTVARGDSPLTLMWKKDGLSLSDLQIPSIKIINFDEFNSMLTIESLHKLHIGNYSCAAVNSAGQSAVSTRINVQVPPSWLEKPSNAEVTLGQKVELPCSADGSPSPKTTWKKEMGKGKFVEIVQNLQDVEVSPKGVLAFKSVDSSHQGQYLCHVTNGVGQPLQVMVNITVKVPPKISVDVEKINAAIKDSHVKMTCDARGDRPFTVKWTKDSRDFLHGKEQGRYSLETLSTSHGIKTVLVINDIVKADAGIYACHLTNPFGSDSQNVKVVVREPPDEPRNLKVLEAGSTSARVSWERPSSHNPGTMDSEDHLPINSFTIEWTPLQIPWEPSKSLEKQVRGHLYSSLLENLRPYTQYKARIRAANDLGTGDPSNVIVFWTLGDKPSGQPVDLKASSPLPSSLFLQWTDPDRSQWNGAIQGYRAGWRRMRHHHSRSSEAEKNIMMVTTTSSSSAGALGAYNWTEIERYDATDLQLLLKDLEPHTKYEILLQAYNQFGRGPVAKIEATTEADAPSSSPEGISCQGVTSAGIELKWDLLSAEKLRGKLSSYKIHYQEATSLDLKDSSNGGVEQVAPSALKVINSKATFVLKGLQPNGNYSIMLNAQTSHGEGPISLPIFCPTKPSVPESPQKLKITVKTDSSVIISWLPPPQRNFVPITGYTLHIRHKHDAAEEISTDQVQIEASDRNLHYIAEGLKSSVYYQFWVVANSLLGQGNASIIQGYRVARSKHNIVGIYSIGHTLRVPVGGSIHLPCLYTTAKDHNVEIDWFKGRGHNVRNSEGRAKGRISIRKNHLEFNNVWLEDAGNYSCRVKMWQMEEYDSITYSVKVEHVPKPPGLRLIETDATSAKLELEDVATESSDIVQPLLWCSIFHRAKFGQPEETLLPARNLISLTIKGLKCGTTYSIYGTCTNAQGQSPRSQPLEAVKTKGHVPLAPSSPSEFVHPSNTSVRLDLFSWTSRTCPIDYFIVSYRKVQDIHWTLVSNDLGLRSRRFTIRQLDPETAYELKIKANNPAGSTDFAYNFHTVSSKAAGNSKAGTQLGIESTQHGNGVNGFNTQLGFMIPLILGLLLVLVLVAGFAVCLKRKMDNLSKRQYLQTEDPHYIGQNTMDKHDQDHHRIYAQVGQSTIDPHHQLFYNSSSHFEADTMGKVPQDPDDIYPYATFVLPDADCGASQGQVPIAAYQDVSDVKRSVGQLLLNPNENLAINPRPHISTLVFQEQSTLPLSDACSKSSNSNPYQMVHNPTTAVSVQGTSTSQRKRTRRKRSSKPLPNPALSSIKQPTMGLASLRQHQATLRRSEECLNSTLSSSDSSSSPIESEPENHPVWTRQRGGQAPPPQADTDTLPSSEDEDPDPEPPGNRIFVKDSNGAFVGVTPNQFHHLKYSERQRLHSSPQETRRKRGGQ